MCGFLMCGRIFMLTGPIDPFPSDLCTVLKCRSGVKRSEDGSWTVKVLAVRQGNVSFKFNSCETVTNTCLGLMTSFGGEARDPARRAARVVAEIIRATTAVVLE